MTGKHKMRLGVLVSGAGTNLEAIIAASESGRMPAAVAIVISDNREAQGLDRARRHGIAAEAIEREDHPSREAFEEAIVHSLKKHRVELVCLAGFMRIVGKTILSPFSERIINIHPALLPAFPGLDAQRQAFEWGVKLAGCTVHFVDEKPDHGPIIIQSAVEVRDDDTLEALKARLLEEEHRIYPEAIALIAQGRARIEGRRVRIEQAHNFS